MNRFTAILFFSMLVMLSGSAALVSIEQVKVTPANPGDEDTLRCEFTIKGSLQVYNVNVTWRANGLAHTSDNEVNIGALNNTPTSTTTIGSIEAQDTKAGDIWVCQVTATDGISTVSSSSQPVTVQITQKLLISDIAASCEPESCDDDDLSAEDAMKSGSGGIIRDVKPGSTITLRFRVENNWPGGTKNHDIEDIQLTCELEDIEDEDEQEEDIDFGDLSPGKRSSREDMVFQIPNNADEDRYAMDCTLEGEDEDGTFYSYDFEIEIDVRKERNSVVFKDVSLTPSQLSCSRDARIGFTIQNVGRTTEKNVQVVVDSQALGISRTFVVTSLNKGDAKDKSTMYSNQLSFTVADSVKPGTYPISLEVFYNDRKDSNLESAVLTVSQCVADVPVTPPTSGQEPVKPEQPKEQVEVVQQPYVPSFQGSQVVTKPVEPAKVDTYTVLLVLAVVLLLIILSFMLGAIARKR